MNCVITAAALSCRASFKDSAGGQVADLSAALIAVANRNQVTGKTGLWVVIGANGSARALAVSITGAAECAAAIGDALAIIVTRADT